MKRIICLISAFVFLFSVRVSALDISAKSAAVIDGKNCELLFSKNCDEKLPMASTTKIMTALLLCEQNDFERQVTVTDEMLKVEGSSMGLLPGDKVSYRDLLYGILLPSGNDAANVTAYCVAGGLEEFAEMMNNKASELGLSNTHFVTPSGLDAFGHYTTAYDLAKLTFYALKNKDFAEAVSSYKKTVCFGNPPYKRTLTNHNKLLNTFEGAVGVKTGFTSKAGRCLVSAAQKDGKLVIAVTLNDKNDWQDHKEMLEYGFSKLQSIEVVPKIKNSSLPVINGQKESVKVNITPYKTAVLNSEEIKYEVFLPEFIYAPVRKGDKIGEIKYFYKGKCVENITVCSDENINEEETKIPFIERIKTNIIIIFKSI